MQNWKLRPAEPKDGQAIFDLILQLAEFEKLLDSVSSTSKDLSERLFSTHPKIFAQVAEASHGELIGVVIYFYNYSTFRGRHGLYIEDLYVSPEKRGSGVGQALFRFVVDKATSEKLSRVEFAVLDWNTKAIEFYKQFGAKALSEWTTFRIEL